MNRKPCKATNCSLARYGTASLCRTHWFQHKRNKREESKARKLARKLGSKKHQESERKKWHKKCWTLISLLVRKSAADWRGQVKCYTCPAVIPWQEANASHFIHNVCDFDLRNLVAACPRCNLYLSGNLGVYAINLVKEHGIEWVEQLRKDANAHKGYGLLDLKAIHADLTDRLKLLESKDN